MTRRLGYPHIASTLALVVALGTGGAYASSLAKNSVTTKQIKNGTITAKDVKKKTLTGAQVKDGSLTGADVAAGTLGKVPVAANVDTVQHLVSTPTLGQSAPMLTRGPFTLTAVCSGPPGAQIATLQLTTAADNSRWVTYSAGDQDLDVADGPAPLVVGNNGLARFNVSAVAASGVSLEVTGFANGGASCRVDVVVTG